MARAHSLPIDRVMMARECERLRAIDRDGSAEAIEGWAHSGIGKIWQTVREWVERRFPSPVERPSPRSQVRGAQSFARPADPHNVSDRPRYAIALQGGEPCGPCAERDRVLSDDAKIAARRFLHFNFDRARIHRVRSDDAQISHRALNFDSGFASPVELSRNRC